ncbi:hypothetical protein C8J57DRAFT_115009 [Mycena rebaudengoi]|nr:hypothetical protein C8J57DRAFT_115009 [Mycena rebaudengoi]
MQICALRVVPLRTRHFLSPVRCLCVAFCAPALWTFVYSASAPPHHPLYFTPLVPSPLLHAMTRTDYIYRLSCYIFSLDADFHATRQNHLALRREKNDDGVKASAFIIILPSFIVPPLHRFNFLCHRPFPIYAQHQGFTLSARADIISNSVP